LLKSFEKSDTNEEDWRILAEERALSSIKNAFAIKRKKHAALSTKIVDGNFRKVI